MLRLQVAREILSLALDIGCPADGPARTELRLLEVLPWLQNMELELSPADVLEETDRTEVGML